MSRRSILYGFEFSPSFVLFPFISSWLSRMWQLARKVGMALWLKVCHCSAHSPSTVSFDILSLDWHLNALQCWILLLFSLLLLSLLLLSLLLFSLLFILPSFIFFWFCLHVNTILFFIPSFSFFLAKESTLPQTQTKRISALQANSNLSEPPVSPTRNGALQYSTTQLLTSGMRGSTMSRKSIVYGAKKQYDATTQRWQLLINRFLWPYLNASRDVRQ